MQLYNSDISGTKNMYFGSVQLKQGFGEFTANSYTCLEKLTTEKCKQQAKQPEKKY